MARYHSCVQFAAYLIEPGVEFKTNGRTEKAQQLIMDFEGEKVIKLAENAEIVYTPSDEPHNYLWRWHLRVDDVKTILERSFDGYYFARLSSGNTLVIDSNEELHDFLMRLHRDLPSDLDAIESQVQPTH